MAHWVTTEVSGQLRTDAADYAASWKDYLKGVIGESEGYQITEGGPVIGRSLSTYMDSRGN